MYFSCFNEVSLNLYWNINFVFINVFTLLKSLVKISTSRFIEEDKKIGIEKFLFFSIR